MFFFLLLWKHEYLFYSLHLRFKNIPLEISIDAIVIESLIFLLLSSFCKENSTLVQVFNEIGLIFTSLSTTPLKWDLEPITISPTRIPFPVLGHYDCTSTYISYVYLPSLDIIFIIFKCILELQYLRTLVRCVALCIAA